MLFLQVRGPTIGLGHLGHNMSNSIYVVSLLFEKLLKDFLSAIKRIDIQLFLIIFIFILIS